MVRTCGSGWRERGKATVKEQVSPNTFGNKVNHKTKSPNYPVISYFPTSMTKLSLGSWNSPFYLLFYISSGRESHRAKSLLCSFTCRTWVNTWIAGHSKSKNLLGAASPFGTGNTGRQKLKEHKKHKQCHQNQGLENQARQCRGKRENPDKEQGRRTAAEKH